MVFTIIAIIIQTELVDDNVMAADWKLTANELAEVRKVLEG